MARKNPAAVELGRLGGRVLSPAKLASNAANARKPRPGAQRYRLTDRGLERRTGHRWALLTELDAKAKAWMRRHR